MKKILLILSILIVFVGCKKDDDQYFDIEVNPNSFSFKPIKGGAELSYNIPKSESIYAIRIVYDNASGEKVTMTGTYGSTKMILKGFFNEENSVRAEVSYVNRSNQISKSIETTFSTLESTTVSVFHNMKVNPYWSGFNVEFEAPEDVEGMINIGYMGISPITGKRELLIKETKAIEPGVNKLSYSDILNESKALEVVVWTEDYSQNLGKRVSYEVIPKPTVMMDNSKLTYTGDSYEFDQYPYKVSWKYLFDGDKTCLKQLGEREGDYLFITKSTVDKKPSGIIDLQEAKVLAFLRVYSPLNLSILYLANAIGAIDGGSPSHMKLYASNNKDAAANDWDEIGEYSQSNTIDEAFRWCYAQVDPSREYKTLVDLESAKPCFIDIKFDVTENKYRYLKVEFLNIYRTELRRNAMCNEMEVFVGE